MDQNALDFLPGSGKLKIPYEVEDPPELEFDFPGIDQFISPALKELYKSCTAIINFHCNEKKYEGVHKYKQPVCVGYGNGSFKGVLIHGFPLRDSINKLMWSEYTTDADKEMLAWWARAYAIVRGRVHSKMRVDEDYILALGLEKFPGDLQRMFEAPTFRSKIFHDNPYAAKVLLHEKLDREAAAEFEARMVREAGFKELEYNDYVRNANKTVKDLDIYGTGPLPEDDDYDITVVPGNVYGEASNTK